MLSFIAFIFNNKNLILSIKALCDIDFSESTLRMNLINCLFYLREKLDNLITYFSMFPNLLGGGWVSVLKEVYELYK